MSQSTESTNEKKFVFYKVLMFLLFVSFFFPVNLSAWSPQKEIKLIVTASTQSHYNGQARIIAAEMEKILKVPVYVDNVPGGNAVQGALQTYMAKPDGSTICLTGSTQLILNQYMFNAKFNVEKFQYIGRCLDGTKMTGTIFTSKQAGLTTFKDVLKYDKVLRWASMGKGTVPWLSTVILSRKFNIKNVQIHGYVGLEALHAVSRGEADAVSFPAFLGRSFVEKNQLNAALVIANERYKPFPNTPTCVEAGIPELVDMVAVHHIIIAPPRTPDDIMKVLDDAVFKAAGSQKMKEYHVKSIEGGKGFGPMNGADTRAVILKVARELKPIIEELKDKD